ITATGLSSIVCTRMTGNTRVDLKVVLLGKEYVGKTALVERFLHDRFLTGSAYQSTIGAAYGSRAVRCRDSGRDREVVLGVWDTAGSERYESMARIYYRGSGAAIVCYEVTDAGSLERARFWTKELRKYEEDRCRIYLCGCKRDLVTADPPLRQVGEAEAAEFAKSVGALSIETSSKTGENVDILFRRVAEDFIKGGAGANNQLSQQQAFALGSGGQGAPSSAAGVSTANDPGSSRGRCYCLG
ncbi:hypothetical protein BOX15_Mlig022053g1, partial [Macrostomum lignano]